MQNKLLYVPQIYNVAILTKTENKNQFINKHRQYWWLSINEIESKSIEIEIHITCDIKHYRHKRNTKIQKRKHIYLHHWTDQNKLRHTIMIATDL